MNTIIITPELSESMTGKSLCDALTTYKDNYPDDMPPDGGEIITEICDAVAVLEAALARLNASLSGHNGPGVLMVSSPEFHTMYIDIEIGDPDIADILSGGQDSD